MTHLVDLQAEIVAERAVRGFTNDPLRILTLLTEEVGEVAHELKKTWSLNYGDFDAALLAPELADVFVLVCALAAAHDIDLERIVRDKFFGADAARTWHSAP